MHFLVPSATHLSVVMWGSVEGTIEHSRGHRRLTLLEVSVSEEASPCDFSSVKWDMVVQVAGEVTIYFLRCGYFLYLQDYLFAH